MNEIFNIDSHISNFGFDCLQNQQLTELQSLEIAEHLSYCDECIEKYTSLLSDSKLIQPPETFKNSTLNKIHQNTLKFFYSKYFSAAVAAGLAIFLWVSGAFNISTAELSKKLEIPLEFNKTSIMDSFSAKFNSVVDNFSSIHKEKENGGNHEKK